MKIVYLTSIFLLAIICIIFNKFINEKIIRNKNLWKGFLARLPLIILMTIIGIPIAMIIFWIADSLILCLIALPFLLFLRF
jgi:hypothetical protein